MKKTDQAIIVEEVFKAPVEYVWVSITELDKMIQWYFDNIPAFEPVVGFETSFIIQVEDRVYPHVWKITEVVPQQKISCDWTFKGISGRSLVTFELIKEKDQTRLKLTNTVLEDFPENVPEFTRESCTGGWNYFIKESLKSYIDKRRA